MKKDINKEELLEKAIDLGWDSEYPLFKEIYIIQQRKLHESGYRQMYVIGRPDYDEKKEDFEYYLVGTYSDVVDFQPVFSKLLDRNYDMCDLHLDINRNGLIHIWTNSDKRLKCDFPHVSSCTFEIV